MITVILSTMYSNKTNNWDGTIPAVYEKKYVNNETKNEIEKLIKNKARCFAITKQDGEFVREIIITDIVSDNNEVNLYFRPIKKLEIDYSDVEKNLNKNNLITFVDDKDFSREDMNSEKQSSKVFIIHGHDDSLKYKTSDFLRQLEIVPIILHEAVNKGMTIIEKLEDNSEVFAAIALLTGDDLGKSKSDNELKKRARQNVIYEAGLFTGKLGRNKVVMLYENGVDLPSDLSGIIYIEIDSSDAWKTKIAKELKAMGIAFDYNKLI